MGKGFPMFLMFFQVTAALFQAVPPEGRLALPPGGH